MAQIQDLDLRQASLAPDLAIDRSTTADEPAPADQSDRMKWLVLVSVVVMAAALLAYVFVQRRRAAPVQTGAVATAPAATAVPAPAPSGPLVEADKIALPPLAETDALVRELVVKLTSHPTALAWLATNGLIENFAVVTLNISEGHTPVQHLHALAPQARFSVLKTDRGVVIDPKSYRRYDAFAAAVSGLDPAGTARLYLTLKPRITEAYRNLGYPEGDFDRVLESAIGTLVATPPADANAALHEKVLSYQYANPDIESLTAAQKQLLRMGPDNMQRVQEKLRAIATQLALKVP